LARTAAVLENGLNRNPATTVEPVLNDIQQLNPSELLKPAGQRCHGSPTLTGGRQEGDVGRSVPAA
jgi:hypothetical protein